MKTRIAALNTALSGDNLNEIQLFPAGTFRAEDGRPADVAHWVMNAVIAAALTAQVAGQRTPLVIDYEHQTLRSVKNGQPAPAAGWFKQLEWREGDGLYATGVEWTENAAAAITAREYRFISPVFLYNDQGHVTQLLHAALTNTPALDGMNEVLIAASLHFAALTTTPPEESPVNEELIRELLSNLRWMLNLSATATAEDIRAELQKAIDLISGGKGTETAAGQSLTDLLKNQTQQIADLSSKAFDPAKFVPVEGYLELQAKLNAERQHSQEHQVDALVQAALSDGRLMPSLENWAKDLGRSNFAALSQHLEAALPVAALSSTQTGGKAPSGAAKTQDNLQSQDSGLNDAALAVCSQFGISPEEMARQLGGQ